LFEINPGVLSYKVEWSVVHGGLNG